MKALSLIMAASLYAANSFAGVCNDLKTCTKEVSDITGQNYIWGQESSKFTIGSSSVEIGKDNAEIIFTALLDQVGLGRLPVGDGKSYRIVPAASLREMELPVVTASATEVPVFGKTWDWVTMKYKLKSPELANHIENLFRLHVPREGRIQGDINSGYVLVTGNTPTVRKMYDTIKSADAPMSAALRAEMKRRETTKKSTN